MKMIVTQSIAPAVQFRLVWLNQLHKKCLTGVKVQNSPYQQCGATQVMALFWFSSSFLHFLSYSSTNLHNTVFPTRCHCFRWLLPLYSSWVTEDHIPENKGIIVPWWVLMLGMRTGCHTRGKRERKQCLRSRNGDAPHAVVLLGYVKLLCAQGQWQPGRMKC